VVIAIWLNAPRGQREVLGLDVEPSHEALKVAIGAVLVGGQLAALLDTFVGNALALVPKSATRLVAGIIRTAFAQPEVG